MSSSTVTDPDTSSADHVDTSATRDTTRVRPGQRSTFRTVVRYAGMPVFLALVLGGLYLWISGQELDSVEQRVLVDDFIIEKVVEHVQLAFASTLAVLLLAVPLGIVATRPGRKRLSVAIVALGNAGQAIPSLGLLALLFFVFRPVDLVPSTGAPIVIIALTAYSFLPILRNTMVGLQQVDHNVLEAGRGMGMSNSQVLRRLELPLAVPVILAGVRTALVINIGTAALAFLFGGGALGIIIFRGYQLNRTPVVLVGAVLTAALALFVDYLAGIAEEQLTPDTLT